jgi:hypothetical protein
MMLLAVLQILTLAGEQGLIQIVIAERPMDEGLHLRPRAVQ